jgi:two-component system response regulator FlrC
MDMPAPQMAEKELVAQDARTRELAALAVRVAASDVSVMIGGESGTGKEVLARHIHRHSGRANDSFVAINCAAIPENMLEAILFGYEKGAFTGAYQSRAGKFEQAQGGTLLLDEISEMDLGLQAKLLRVIQENEVERLGGGEIIALNVRILATTNRKLIEEVRAGRFREDLYYRLNVFPINLPPLRERPDDIMALARELILRHSPADPLPELTPHAEQKLLSYNWPGNVRELENVIQRALILKSGSCIDSTDIFLESHDDDAAPVVDASTDTRPAMPASGGQLGNDLRLRERALIMEALEAGNGSRKEAAQRLGISARTLRYKLARLRDAGLGITVQVGMRSA